MKVLMNFIVNWKARMMTRFLTTLVMLLMLSPFVRAGDGACDVPNMLGDGGLLQPNLFVSSSRLFSMQQHATKICENNSVIPRDRLGFHFASLQDVRIGDQGGEEIDRSLQEYRFLLEKTFLQENVSLELIVPVHFTSQSKISTTDEFGRSPLADGAFGDLAFGLKALLWEGNGRAFSAGLRIEAPTAPDISISEVPPGVVSHFDMDSWYFTPWIGAQWTPGNRWFASAFGSYRMDSGPIDISTVTRDVSIRQPNYLSVDVALGRWIVQRPCRRGITSLAPTLEMHYTTTTTRGTVFDPGFQNVYDTGRRYGKTDYLNLTAGMNGTINEDWQFALGVVAPLRTSTTDGQGDFDTDRNFDWAIMLNINYYFR